MQYPICLVFLATKFSKHIRQLHIKCTEKYLESQGKSF